MNKYKTTIQPADRNPEFEVVVGYAFHRGDPGRTSGPPERCYPPEPAYIEIISVMHGAIDIEIYLSDEQMAWIEQEIEADITAAQEAAAERHDEQMREYRAEYLQEAKRDPADARNIEYWEKFA